MPIRVVLFDAVGTLIEARPPVAEVYLEAGRRFGTQRSLAEIRQRFRTSFGRHGQAGRTDEENERCRWRAIVREVLDDVHQDAERLFEVLWEHFANSANWHVFDDVPSAWAALEQVGLMLGLASNFDARLVSVCRHLAPLRRAKFVFCSSQIGHSKPCLEFFQAVENVLHVPGDEILLVGDDKEADVQGARRAGWHAVHLDRHATTVAEETLTTLGELVGICRRLAMSQSVDSGESGVPGQKNRPGPTA